MMKAVVITEFGAPEVLQIAERPIPIINDDEVLVRVKAAGINRPDVAQRKGHYPAPKGVPIDIPGLEISGYIEKVGANVHHLSVGDDVMALVAGGGYAEYVAVASGLCMKKPANMTYIEAASLPETLFTVWSNVFERGCLKEGESFLVHGGSSGIGITAIQLAKAIGARVIYTTVGNEEKKAFCESLGAIAINYNINDFSQQIEEVDVILDMVGGSYFSKNIDILNPEGRLVYINAMSGIKVELNLLKVMQKRISITGSTLRARELSYKEGLARRVETSVLPLIEKGLFKTIIDQTFSLNDADKAHSLMESSQHIGKIVLAIDA